MDTTRESARAKVKVNPSGEQGAMPMSPKSMTTTTLRRAPDHDSQFEDYSVGPHVGLFAKEPQDEEPENYTEYIEEEIEEWEATALNAIVDLDGNDPEVDVAALDEAIQLEWAAMAAFGKAKGKGKGKMTCRGKGKSKVVRSNLTLDQRRAKLQEVKARSRCLRCGGLGHWAGIRSAAFRKRNLPLRRPIVR